jgi:hypothetical protein
MPSNHQVSRSNFARRLREFRVECWGEASALAAKLGLPELTWRNYERGVTMPAEVLLRLIDVSGVEPAWLLNGRGPMFRRPVRWATEASLN